MIADTSYLSMPNSSPPNWQAPQKPAETAETRLISAILDGHFPIDSNLPAERELATLIGVTRPTLREALQRLARDGWIEIRQGKPTRVRNYWQEGNLAVLGAIARHLDTLPLDFVANLLAVRCLLAPEYTRQAVARAPLQVCNFLQEYGALADTPPAYSYADFDLHHFLTVASGNPVFTLILNGFRDLYLEMACQYFADPAARAHSRAFYASLLASVRANDSQAAEEVTQQVMADSLNLWQATLHHSSPGS